MRSGHNDRLHQPSAVVTDRERDLTVHALDRDVFVGISLYARCDLLGSSVIGEFCNALVASWNFCRLNRREAMIDAMLDDHVLNGLTDVLRRGF
jgi:hypothetical protein